MTRFLSLAAIAKRLNTTVEQINEWRQKGVFPPPSHIFNRQPYWTEEQIAEKEKAPELRQQSKGPIANNLNSKGINKISRVEAALKLPHGLNRFEAERIGDHCLNSTVANLRMLYGSRLVSEWETVPTRYCERGVRVLRYWIVGDGNV